MKHLLVLSDSGDNMPGAVDAHSPLTLIRFPNKYNMEVESGA